MINGLSLRINRGGVAKVKNMGLTVRPVEFSDNNYKEFFSENKLSKYADFITAKTADEQLTILRELTNELCEDELYVKFLAIVFLEAPIKHPVKGFLLRYITKSKSLEDTFSDTLAMELSTLTAATIDQSYEQYTEVVTKISSCLENFPAGSEAVRRLELGIAEYLNSALDCCIAALRKSETNVESISPLAKSEIFALSHLSIRLLLHIIQKSSENSKDLLLMFQDIRDHVKYLVLDKDTPMDTKNVGGIILLAMHVAEYGEGAWTDILAEQKVSRLDHDLLQTDSGQLALYGAVATSVTAEQFETCTDGETTLQILIDRLVDIGMRLSADSTFVLGVSRTMLQLARTISRLAPTAAAASHSAAVSAHALAHVDHHSDSVAHLAGQTLAIIVANCARIYNNGRGKVFEQLTTSILSLDKCKKSYYICANLLVANTSACELLAREPNLIRHGLDALAVQALQASAALFLSRLLQKHIAETSASDFASSWLRPMLGVAADSIQLQLLQPLLQIAAEDDRCLPHLLEHIKSSQSHQSCANLKSVLMVARAVGRSRVQRPGFDSGAGLWKGLLHYQLLEAAVVDACDETRLLALSLVVESPKSTEVFSEKGLGLVLHYLRYNVNAQSPNFRQLTLSYVKKFMKRFEESYKSLQRKTDEANTINHESYLLFMHDLREFCFGCLRPGANYSRRYSALQVLVWSEGLDLSGYERLWRKEFVQRLLWILDDTYDITRGLALEMLYKCPVSFLEERECSALVTLAAILNQASSVKPTECACAAYKLRLLKEKLPHKVTLRKHWGGAEPVAFQILCSLHEKLTFELLVAKESLLKGSSEGPMYGLLHSITDLYANINAQSISADGAWSELTSEVINTAIAVTGAVEPVVNNCSPEGHMQLELESTEELPQSVTSQMLLLCAWRSVKESSLLLGVLSSRLTIASEGLPYGTLSPSQLSLMGEHFAALLRGTKHRGAFEQAHVGFTQLAHRLWRCKSPSLHGLPRKWLSDLLTSVSNNDAELCHTRRSAGVPYCIQALVSTELESNGDPRSFHSALTTLLTSATSHHSLETRTHCLNILRALYRNTALGEAALQRAEEGLIVAIKAIDSHCWAERNSATLLFSALMVRIFGVQRGRDPTDLCVRNKMTGRIFFLRHPNMFQFMLDILERSREERIGERAVMCSSVFAVLLLLARLYPSSLEGTVSNLKLESFLPPVLCCARSCVLKSRQLAARAITALVLPDRYFDHVASMFEILSDQNIPRNYCHGILLQLSSLLGVRPEALPPRPATAHLPAVVRATSWIFQQGSGHKPCYMLVYEYCRIWNSLICRFPEFIDEESLIHISKYLKDLLEKSERNRMFAGQDIALANCFYLQLVLEKSEPNHVPELVKEGLQHSSYDVILAALNYALFLHDKLDSEQQCQFLKHIEEFVDKNSILSLLNTDDLYKDLLCKILKNCKYLECAQKSLQLLTLTPHTQRQIVASKYGNAQFTDEEVINHLLELTNEEHDSLTHIYLGSLLDFVSSLLAEGLGYQVYLHVVRLLYWSCGAQNDEEIRDVALGFLERSLQKLLVVDIALIEEDKFEYKTTLWASMTTLIQDDNPSFRQRTSDIITHLANRPTTDQPESSNDEYQPIRSNVTANKGAEMLLDLIAKFHGGNEASAVYLVMGLLDFKSEVCVTDDASDENRVFDHNERYNVHLEEAYWSKACCDRILQTHGPEQSARDYVIQLMAKNHYQSALRNLCNDHLEHFKKLVIDNHRMSDIHPKVDVFVSQLCT